MASALAPKPFLEIIPRAGIRIKERIFPGILGKSLRYKSDFPGRGFSGPWDNSLDLFGNQSLNIWDQERGTHPAGKLLDTEIANLGVEFPEFSKRKKFPLFFLILRNNSDARAFPGAFPAVCDPGIWSLSVAFPHPPEKSPCASPSPWEFRCIPKLWDIPGKAQKRGGDALIMETSSVFWE